jgi:hypothetical protein
VSSYTVPSRVSKRGQKGFSVLFEQVSWQGFGVVVVVVVAVSVWKGAGGYWK